MSSDPVRYDPDALDRFLGDLPVVVGHPCVTTSWAPALPAAQAPRVVRRIVEHCPCCVREQPQHNCQHGQPCEAS